MTYEMVDILSFALEPSSLVWHETLALGGSDW